MRRWRNCGADTAESRYAKAKVAKWLSNLLESGIVLDSSFFECLEWSLGDLRGLVERLKNAAAKMPDNADFAGARGAVKKLAKEKRKSYLAQGFVELVEEHPRIEKHLLAEIGHECAAAARTSKEESAAYLRARRRLQRTFGLDGEACALCEFIFIKQSFNPVESYFEDELHLFGFAYKKLLSDMFRAEASVLRKRLSELNAWGICNVNECSSSLTDGLEVFWEDADDARMEAFSCHPLRGKILSLDSFDVPPETVSHVRSLLESGGGSPIHILLYGPPGTGKTTFARSLAHELNLKAWSVSCGEGRENDDRRSELVACLHMASRHKGSFVLLDEAERFLDTGACYGWHSGDKAWLNEFLEQPGRRVVWIVNDIGHIDPAVRRRFTFSVHFRQLGRVEQKRAWSEILAEHGVKNRLSETQIEKFVRDYSVAPAVIESAVHQAKNLGRGERGFAETVEQVLLSSVILSHDGAKPCPDLRMFDEYAPDGVCLEGSVTGLLEKSRRIDAMMRKGESIRPGGATMLFYGPPGTGKSALAGYLASELNRELVIKRASDLLGPFVGMSEALVAKAFQNAKEAVLMIDEVDSFLYSREIAVQSWESTLVNEFLTSLERCREFCICTTNRMQNLDSAALRRFSFKVPFDYAGRSQIEALYRSLLAPLADGEAPARVRERLLSLPRLTPGDFHAVKSQYWLAEPGEVTHEELVEGLVLEQEKKTDRAERRAGF